MDADVTTCWCLVLYPFRVYKQANKRNPKYKLVFTVKTIDKHPKCCETKCDHVIEKENKKYEIGPY